MFRLFIHFPLAPHPPFFILLYDPGTVLLQATVFSLPGVGFDQLGVKGVLVGFSKLENEGLILIFFLHVTVNESGHSWPWQYSLWWWIAPMAPASVCPLEGFLFIQVVSDMFL